MFNVEEVTKIINDHTKDLVLAVRFFIRGDVNSLFLVYEWNKPHGRRHPLLLCKGKRVYENYNACGSRPCPSRLRRPKHPKREKQGTLNTQ